MAQASRPRIAIFSGPNATIQNSPPLVTSNKARAKYGLPPHTNRDGSPPRYDVMRPQRLAAPVTVYVEQFSAHPMERDAAELYGPPDGYVDRAGAFHRSRQGPDDVAVFEVLLDPADGLYLLPYMARQATGEAWEEYGTRPLAPQASTRQPFYPDASRIVEEIDRFGVGEDGWGCSLQARADFDFIRAAPSAGYSKGLAAADRTDLGQGDIPEEVSGLDFFPYRPQHLRREPPRSTLARLTNVVQRTLSTNSYAGAIWLEGTPSIEETVYWLGLLIDTSIPIVGNAGQRAHGALANDGDRNIVDSVDYILSRIWTDADGNDIVGSVVVQDEQIFSAREVQKGDARPGGYVVTGGHGGIVGTIGKPGPPVLTFRPVRRHTSGSAVNLARLPRSVTGVCWDGYRAAPIDVPVKEQAGQLLESAIPKVTIVKTGLYLADSPDGAPDGEVEILARIDANLKGNPLSGLVAEGTTPYGTVIPPMEAALRRAALSGMPVVRVARGNAEGFVPASPTDLTIGGGNLTATKARLLLMACLLKLGSPPPVEQVEAPTQTELQAIRAKLDEYQEIFDTH